MARISGIDIPREKRVEISLTYIFGIGLPTSQKILAQANINPDTRVRDLTDDQVNRLREIVDRRYKVEGDLRREVALNIKRLQEIGSYRGLRHRRNLPARGQRTKTNARQRRGPKRTVGVRIPDHVFDQALLEALGEALLTSSLILPGESEPRTMGWEGKEELDHEVDIVVEAGETPAEPTTVIDWSEGVPEVVRVGAGDPARFVA